ncbi:MAG: DUF4476 domain-containing protein [Myxococcales bacterium]|nr:DUF4476 domain-containing protein [Myxococcales bacterium]
MRRLAVAAVFVCSLSAYSQSIDVHVNGLHAGVQVQGVEVEDAPAPAVVVQAPPPRVVGGDAFRVDYAMSGSARLVVASPEGLAAQVWSDAALEGQFVVPFAFEGRAGQYYRVILSGADGAPVFDRKVLLAAWKQATVSLARAAPAPVVVVAPAPVVVQQAPVAPGMPASDFAALRAAVEAEDFSSDKLGVIRSAVDGGAALSCAQVGQLVDLLDMSSDKVQVVALTRGRLVDPGNGYSLLQRFTFSSDKEKVRRLLGG